MSIMDVVVRCRKTEDRLRQMDAVDMVKWVHQLEDEAQQKHVEIERLMMERDEARKLASEWSNECGAEVEQLRDLINNQSDNHVAHTRALEDQHDLRVSKYAEKVQQLEAENKRLRSLLSRWYETCSEGYYPNKKLLFDTSKVLTIMEKENG